MFGDTHIYGHRYLYFAKRFCIFKTVYLQATCFYKPVGCYLDEMLRFIYQCSPNLDSEDTGMNLDCYFYGFRKPFVKEDPLPLVSSSGK